jgi:hypothetical protein
MTISYDSISKAEWIGVAENYYQRLVRELRQLTTEDWDQMTPYLGWRGYEVLAHMASSNTMNFQLLLDLAMKGHPVPPAPFNFFLRNAAEVKKRRKHSISEILEEFISTLNGNLRFYKQLTEVDWLRPAWFFVGDVNIRSLFLIQLSDIVVHERDLMLAKGNWHGFDSQILQPLTDWFLREFRPASLRHQQTEKTEMSIVYRLSGSAVGEWTTRIRNGKCEVAQGACSNPDIVMQADAEDLITASLARVSPRVGSISRRISALVRPSKREDFVATVTAYLSLGAAIASRRVRISGHRAKFVRLRNAFWHFGERGHQTELSMKSSLLKDVTPYS